MRWSYHLARIAGINAKVHGTFFLLLACFRFVLRTSQHEFPVTDTVGKVCGILTRDEMIDALRKLGPEAAVSEVMRRDIPSVPQSMLFDRAYALMQECPCPALPVLDASDKLIGLFTPENVGEMIMVQSALSARAH